MGFINSLKHAWNAFKNADYQDFNYPYGVISTQKPTLPFLRGSFFGDKSIVNSLYTQIANDVSSASIKQVKYNDDGQYEEDIQNGLNWCLNVQANIDQSGKDFIRDAVISLFDEGVIALVPTETDDEPKPDETFDIYSMRVGRIKEWYPKHVLISVYNDQTGLYEDIIFLKETVAIVENPFYMVMNEPNSTVQRLRSKLSLLDVVDENASFGKLDLIIQLPYPVRNEGKKAQAEERVKSIEDQLKGSKYGVAYIDAIEKVVQLNRPVENNLLEHVQYLTNQLYAQLGLNQAVFDGTATEEVMVNYTTRTVSTVLEALCDGMRRAFLTQKAIYENQNITYFLNPFRYASSKEIADMADTYTRNEILSSNEVRSILGYKPSNNPRANELVNKNLRVSDQNLIENGGNSK